jgi:hypothetical protein
MIRKITIKNYKFIIDLILDKVRFIERYSFARFVEQMDAIDMAL